MATNSFVEILFLYSGSFFVDFNSIVPNQENLSDLFSSKNMDVFAGVGIRLGLQNIYKTVIRADMSINPANGEFSSIILGLGQFF